MSDPKPPWLAEFVLDAAPATRERHGCWDLFDPVSAEPRPLVAFVHGGPVPRDLPASPRDWPVFRGYGALAAASGLVGMTVDHGFHTAGEFAPAYVDVRSAIDAVRTDDRVDGDTVAVWVFSGGGPLIAPLLATPPSWLRCLAASYPILDSRPGRELPAGFRPIEALRAGGSRVPLVLTTVGLETEVITAGIDRFRSAAHEQGYDVQEVHRATGHHGFDHQDYGPESEQVVREGLRLVSDALAG